MSFQQEIDNNRKGLEQKGVMPKDNPDSDSFLPSDREAKKHDTRESFPGEYSGENAVEGTNYPGNYNYNQITDDIDGSKSSCLNCPDEERLPTQQQERGKNPMKKLEKAAADFSQANSKHPFLFEMPPEKGRATVDKVQDSDVYKYPVDMTDEMVDTGKWGSIKVYTLVPEGLDEKNANVIYYIHGAGWVFGDEHTHDKLVRELAARTQSVVVFPEYTLSPEAKYPTAIEQCYAVLQKTVEKGKQKGWNMDCLTVCGDSVGGNMATVMTIMTKERGGAKIDKQLLYYPVTNASFDTGSYNEFAENYYLYKEGMKWFWDQYTTSEQERNEITASPLRATTEQLKGLPQAMILNGECDVLRDEGEEYARCLRDAGVDVTSIQFQGMIHDFVMLHTLDQTKACRAAMDVSIDWINKLNGCKPIAYREDKLEKKKDLTFA